MVLANTIKWGGIPASELPKDMKLWLQQQFKALPNYFEAVLPATVESELDSPSGSEADLEAIAASQGKPATIHAEPDPKLEVHKELKEAVPVFGTKRPVPERQASPFLKENMPDDTEAVQFNGTVSKTKRRVQLQKLSATELRKTCKAFGLQNKGCKAKLVDRLVEQEAAQKKVSAKPEQRFEAVRLLSECKKAQIGVERKRTLEAEDFFGYWGVA